MRQTYRDTLNYYRRHITSTGLFVFSHCNGEDHERSAPHMHCFPIFYCSAVNWRTNEIKYAGHTAPVFTVTFVSSHCLYKQSIIMLYYSLIAHYATMWFNKGEEGAHGSFSTHRRRFTSIMRRCHGTRWILFGLDTNAKCTFHWSFWLYVDD